MKLRKAVATLIATALILSVIPFDVINAVRADDDVPSEDIIPEEVLESQIDETIFTEVTETSEAAEVTDITEPEQTEQTELTEPSEETEPAQTEETEASQTEAVETYETYETAETSEETEPTETLYIVEDYDYDEEGMTVEPQINDLLEGAEFTDFDPSMYANIPSTAHRFRSSSPASGRAFIQVNGRFDNTSVDDILNLINSYRYEACVNHYPDPRDTSRTLQESDYVPMRWSYGLEEMAMLRAVESSITYGHSTLSGDSIWSQNYGVSSSAETIAWTSSLLGGIRLWYSEKTQYINGVTDFYTIGHYTSMINPSNRYIGLAGFYKDGSSSGTYLAEYCYSSSNETKINVSSYSSQICEVLLSNLSSVQLSCSSDTCYPGDGFYMSLTANLTSGSRSYTGLNLLPDSWSSSAPGVATVNAGGKVTAVSAGTTVISCSFNGTTYSKRITVTEQIIPGWHENRGRYYYVNTDGSILYGWQTLDGNRYYFGSDSFRVTGFQTISGKKYYFDPNGIMLTGWQIINGSYYLFNNDGSAYSGWYEVGSGSYFFTPNGKRVTGFRNISGRTYYFNPSSGLMMTGWQDIDGHRYYFKKSGRMVTGWKVLSNKTYYFSEDGIMQTGWQDIDGSRYYFKTNGYMVTGWKTLSGKTYYFGTDGVMVTGWQTIDGSKYYFTVNGKMITGWRKISGKVYYFDGRGVMATGTRVIDGVTYTFRNSGVCTNPPVL